MSVLKKLIFNRMAMLGVAFVLQLLFLLAMLDFLSQYSQVFYFIGITISILAMLKIIYDDSNFAYKLVWIVSISILPIFGGIFYISFSGNQLSNKEKKRMNIIEERTKELLPINHDLTEDMAHSHDVQHINYLQNYGPYPGYTGNETLYFPTGESNYVDMLEELSKAEKFIFIEYFIIEEGQMWQGILDILIEKASKGVDVRVIYDDLGCSTKLPHKYHKWLRKKHIKCEKFNPLVPVISSKYNTRDHRKIMVIDGHTAYTGGINLADEYINKVERFGHWKDMGIKIKGTAVWSFTTMFLTLWDYLSKEITDVEKFRSDVTGKEKGIVIPYSDNPLDNESVGENVYLNLINKAKDYVYITTPYLVISSEMMTALCNAAKNGVDVRIITPHHPDKWYVHQVSRSYYDKLIRNGVGIYEYEPGFMHGKNFVVDDRYAVVGTINLDFRSLYLHFECGLWMMDTESVMDVKKDFDETLKKCIHIDAKMFREMNWFKKLIGIVLRLYAPLM